MNINQIFGNRFSMLRINSGMSQREFANDFSDFIDRDKSYTLVTISSWEIGNKLPPFDVAVNIARYFKVSMDWLLGFTGEDGEPQKLDTPASTATISSMEANLIIKDDQLKGFDKQPVYVVFNNMDLPNRWGVLDYGRNRIVFTDALMNLNNGLDFTLYSNIPDAERSPKYNIRKPLSMSQILKKQKDETIWVEMKSMDGIVKAKYNGWYSVNPETKCLENIGMGFILPLHGLSISYDAFSSER